MCSPQKSGCRRYGRCDGNHTARLSRQASTVGRAHRSSHGPSPRCATGGATTSCYTDAAVSSSRGGPHNAMAIPGEKAIQMVRSAHAQAAQMDIAVTAVVVDQSGRMIALGRMDRARPITVEIALNKAYTAASFQQPTKELASVAGQTWFQSLVVSSNGRIMPGAGALPIVEGGSVVGAIAVAGGTDDQDQKCAEVALASYS